MTVFTYLTVEQVLFTHMCLIAETGGSPGLRDPVQRDDMLLPLVANLVYNCAGSKQNWRCERMICYSH